MLKNVWFLFCVQIALRREKMGETAPFWNFSAASYPDLEAAMSNGSAFKEANRSLDVDTSLFSRVLSRQNL